MAGEQASGATAYVTLEPCAHHGRTGPCAEALAKAGIARVVTAIEDPDPRVSGQGHAILRAAGVAVDVGLGAEEASHDLAGFLTRITRKRPYVTLKIGVSADGKIAAGPRSANHHNRAGGQGPGPSHAGAKRCHPGGPQHRPD